MSTYIAPTQTLHDVVSTPSSELDDRDPAPVKRCFSETDMDCTESPSPSAGSTKTKRFMRKRAKTDEEKEARAQERVMRNRAAAQVSREKKRAHMEALEIENTELKNQIETLTDDNTHLRRDVETLTQRLESMEKSLALFMSSNPLQNTDISVKQEPVAPQLYPSSFNDINTNTPRNLSSVSSFSQPELINSRNPAVIVNGPQRRTLMRFSRKCFTQTPLSRLMAAVLSFWATTLQTMTFRVISKLTMTYLTMPCFPEQKLSLLSAQNHWRSLATGSAATAKLLAGKEHWSVESV